MLKAEIRKIYLTKQKSLSEAERQKASKQIRNLFFDSFDLNKIFYLHCFLPIEKFNEINTRLIFERIWREFRHVETLVPRVNFETKEIENLKFSPEIELIENEWKIHEPTHNELIETDKIDAVLVPLLCFDEEGFRVGYGKGFYDKFLKTCRTDCLKIGLSYFEPVAEISDAESHDVEINYCVTPERIWKFSTKKAESRD